MNKVLLVFSYEINNDKEFEQIINKFEDKGYIIINFSGLSKDFDIMSLPLYIEYAKGQMESRVGRVTVLSNLKELIFTWYRGYNSLVDDFIYFIDDNNIDFKLLDDNNMYDIFYKQLSNFIGIENETVQGRIYLNLSFNNYSSLFYFLIRNDNFNYFNSLSNFDFENKIKKKKLNKVYQYKDHSLTFKLETQKSNEEIVIEGNLENNINLNLELIKKLDNNYYYVVYILIELYKIRNKEEANKLLIAYFNYLKTISLEKQQKICQSFIEYIKEKELNFFDISNLLSLLLILDIDKIEIFKEFIFEIDFTHKSYSVSPRYNELNVFYQIAYAYFKMNHYIKCIELCEGHLKNYTCDVKIMGLYIKCLDKLRMKDKLKEVCDQLLFLDNNNYIALDIMDKYSLRLNNENKLGEEIIVLLKGQSQYNAGGYYIDSLLQGFNELGYKAKILDFSSNEFKDLLKILLKNKVKFVLALNGKIIKHITKELSYFQHIQFVSKYADHPVYHYNRLLSFLENEKIVCVDKTHKEFLEEVLNLNSTFIPAGAHINFNIDKSIIDKDNDIIFAGTIKDPGLFRKKWLQLEGGIAQIYDELAEYALSKEFLNIKNDIDYILEYNGINIESDDMKKIYEYGRLVDKYVRNYRRIKIINELNGLDIKVFGNGWSKFIEDKKSYTIRNSIDFKELIQEIRQAKILINVLPEFSYNGHERIFNAMYYGTAVATNANEYLRSNFKDEEDIIYYSWKKIGQLPNKLSDFLNNEKRLKKLTKNGQDKVINSHTLLHRAREIMSCIE